MAARTCCWVETPSSPGVHAVYCGAPCHYHVRDKRRAYYTYCAKHLERLKRTACDEAVADARACGVEDLGSSTEALLAAPPYVELIWCNQRIKIHRRAIGRHLVEYLVPHTASHTYYMWGVGGGMSLTGPTLEAAVAEFEEAVAKERKFWMGRLRSIERIIVGGEMYLDGGWSTAPPSMRGFGGDVRVYRPLADPTRMLATNNLWHSGRIPPEYRGEADSPGADTHEFVYGLTKEQLEAVPRSPVRPPKQSFSASADQQRIIDA